MLRGLKARRFALVFAIVLGLVALFFVHGSSAGSVYILHGSSSDFCNRTGQSVPGSATAHIPG